MLFAKIISSSRHKNLIKSVPGCSFWSNFSDNNHFYLPRKMKELSQIFKANIALLTSISDLHARVSQLMFWIRLMKTLRTFSITLFTWQDKPCAKLWNVGTSSLKKFARFCFSSFFWKNFKDYISYCVKNLKSWIKVCCTHFFKTT